MGRREEAKFIEDYRKSEIKLRNDGTFEALVDGVGMVTANGLIEIRKEVDKAGAVKKMREPGFTFGSRYYGDGEKIEAVTVTSVIAEDGYREGSAWLSSKDGGRSKISAGSVYKDTPENRELGNQYLSLIRQARVLEKQANKLLETIPSFASDLPKKVKAE